MCLRLGKHEFRLTWLRGIGLALLGVYLAHVAMPLYWHRPGADDCTFGPVTNAQYRELKRKANRELFWAKFYLPFDEGERARRIAEAMETVAGDTQSLFVRLAAMHAVMRALNGQHRVSYFKGDLESRVMERGGVVRYDGDRKPYLDGRYKIRGNMAEIGKDPSLEQDLRKKNSYKPISFQYVFNAVAERFLIRSLIPRIYQHSYRSNVDIIFSNIYLGGKYINNEYLDNFYISTNFEFSDLAGTKSRLRFANKPPRGPCPVVPSENWVKDFIAKYQIKNVR